MAKHRRLWNERTYQNYLHEGRGQGTGKDYKPWISIQDFPSKGMVSRVKGNKTGRIHHFMSNLELAFFFLLEWSDKVTDVREQYPLLDMHRIIELAEKAHIRYPYDPQSGFPYVMTSDFFIDTVNGTMAVAIKPEKELEKLRIREKLEIERRYWNSKKTDWKLVTENEINTTKARNIEWLTQARDLGQFGISEKQRELYCGYFLMQYRESTYLNSLGRLFQDIEHKFNLLPGMGLNIYKYLAYWKRINFDVNKAISYSDFLFRTSKGMTNDG